MHLYVHARPPWPASPSRSAHISARRILELVRSGYRISSCIVISHASSGYGAGERTTGTHACAAPNPV